MLLLIDKPKGITSHDVVDRVRNITHERRVGHAGTLDPNATGLLIVAVGREHTKKLGELTKNTKKTYIAEIMLGEERDTDDSEGVVVLTNTKKIDLNTQKVEQVLKSFLGKQEQVPPIYSAIKLKGKKAYELARKGEKMEMKPREIEIYRIKLISLETAKLIVEFEVSSGTYIRSLARDIGRKLGTYGYLSNLRRTQIGDYSIENADTLEQLAGIHTS